MLVATPGLYACTSLVAANREARPVHEFGRASVRSRAPWPEPVSSPPHSELIVQLVGLSPWKAAEGKL